MERIEQELRASLNRVVQDAPTQVGLGERIIHRGRRKHRQRVAVAGAAVAAVLVVAGAVLVPMRHPVSEPAQPVPSGPPTVAMSFENSDGNQLLWPSGHVTGLENGVAVGEIPEGALILDAGELRVLPENGSPRSVLTGVQGTDVAVAPDGRHVVVVRLVNGRRQLQEVELETGTVGRRVPLAPPLVADGESIGPAFYSGDSVMLNIGDQKSTAVWEPGSDQVIGKLTGFTATIGGGRLGALAMTEKKSVCTTVGILGAGFNRGSVSCNEDFIGFSPDGAHDLVAGNKDITVRDTGDGDEAAVFTPPGQVRAIGWESDDTFLYVRPGEGQVNLVVRCGISSKMCRTIGPADNRVPTPLPQYGP